jgi:glyceraldehyde 3-phosphate dehydrogenase
MAKDASHIGLLGMGRMGRNLFRLLHDSADLHIVAVSDAANLETLTYLLRFDTLLGRFPAVIGTGGDGSGGWFQVAGRQIRLLPAGKAGEIHWGDLGVDTVIDATESRQGRAELERHLAAGARRVIACTPPTDPPDITFVAGVNDAELRAGQRLISCASPATQAVAPVASILHQAFGIRHGYVTMVHAYSDQQRLADMPAEEPRRGRAAAANIVPLASDEASLLEQVLPELRGRLTALAMNVPVADGSVADLVCWHDRPVTVAEVNRVVGEAAAAPRWAGLLEVEDNPIVSSDILRRDSSGTFDSLATMVLAGNVSKTLTWFDNGWGYAHRVADLVRRCHAAGRQERP